MVLTYKTVSMHLLKDGKKDRQVWFPKLTRSRQMNLKQIARELQKRSTASNADVYLVVKGLVDLIPELLAQGYTLKLDELGTFRLHARVNPVEAKENVSARQIKQLHLTFRADNAIKQALQHITVKPESNNS
ncbi:HU family DNA-binding protein [Saccharicrinis sp. FJH54]|uniref:HU family DNA-binding protein n=1 Tax=Saccharicrinis sp. FJH54 TaxID=3344665 RepID=UPI0035D3F973